jgi:hypothetical protein
MRVHYDKTKFVTKVCKLRDYTDYTALWDKGGTVNLLHRLDCTALHCTALHCTANTAWCRAD